MPTAAEKLEQVRVRISDLGSLLADVVNAQRQCPLAGMLFRRLWAIREIILDETTDTVTPAGRTP